MTSTYIPPDSKVDNLGLAKVVDGKAPKSRISDPKRAQELGHKLVDQGRERSRKNALIKGLLDGNRPFSPARLKAAAQSWRTNVNFGEADAAVSAANTPFYDLFSGSQYLFDIKTDFGANLKEKNDFSVAITEEADYCLKEWEGFYFYMDALINDLVAYGKGFLYWLDPTDWRFEWLAQHQIFVPDKTKAFTGKLTVAVVRGEYQVDELWRKIRSPKAEEVGWNVPFAKVCIENAYPQNRDNSGQSDYEAIQQRIRDNDISEGMEASVIPVFHIFVAELDGKGKESQVSHLIVPETMMPTHDGRNKAVDFIFESVGAYKKFSQVIATFFFETLDGSWNGANGLGKKIFDSIELKNRLKCTTCDGAFLRAGISLRAMDAASLDKASLIQIGAFNIIPPGFEVQQSTIMGDIQGPMQVDNMLDRTISSNTGIYKPKMDKPEGNPRTAEEVRLNFQAGATLGGSSVNRFYLNLDRFYTELIRRLALDADFKTKCKDRGIPEEALKKIRSVKAHRAVGNGSPFMRQQAMQRIAPLVPLMPEHGRQNWAIDSVSSETNQYTAMRYFPNEETDVMRSRDAYDAHNENIDIPGGGSPMWADFQNNVIHAQSHIQFAAQSLGSLQAGAEPLRVMATLDIVGPHINEHLLHIQKDGYHDQELKALSAQFAQISAQADELRKAIKEQQEANAERAQQEQQAQAVEAGIDPETRIAMAKAAGDERRKDTKQAQSLQHKSEAHNQKMAISDAKTAAAIIQTKAKQEAQEQPRE